MRLLLALSATSALAASWWPGSSDAAAQPEPPSAEPAGAQEPDVDELAAQGGKPLPSAPEEQNNNDPTGLAQRSAEQTAPAVAREVSADMQEARPADAPRNNGQESDRWRQDAAPASEGPMDTAAAVLEVQRRLAGYALPEPAELERLLTPVQMSVIRRNRTEAPYTNEYWSTTDAGVYVDRLSGEPLFSSADKFIDRKGWPCFSQPLPEVTLATARDESHGRARTLVHSRLSGSFLGQVFEGAERSPTGRRYQLNSAALRFVPVSEMDSQGLGGVRRALFGGAGRANHPEL